VGLRAARLGGAPLIATGIAFTILALAACLAGWRLMRGPTLPDRVIALDLVSVIVISMVVLATLVTGDPVYFDVAIVLALISFLGTVAFSRYLERVNRT
jgi:multicomponent Na+:H+ antiporter subunit F